MSKAQNYFKIVELRRSEELSKALRKACAYVTSDCSLCPLFEKDDCASVSLPPAAIDKEGYPAEGICEDWLQLHFLGAKNNA